MKKQDEKQKKHVFKEQKLKSKPKTTDKDEKGEKTVEKIIEKVKAEKNGLGMPPKKQKIKEVTVENDILIKEEPESPNHKHHKHHEGHHKHGEEKKKEQNNQEQ